MENMRLTDGTAEDFLQAAQLFITEILALNLERSNEEIIQTYRGFSGDIATMSESVLDSLRADQDFVKNAEEFRKEVEKMPIEDYNEDSEAASV
jgi:hypothetical protein